MNGKIQFKSFGNKMVNNGYRFLETKETYFVHFCFSYENYHKIRFVNNAGKASLVHSPHTFNLIHILFLSFDLIQPRPASHKKEDETFTRHLADMTYHHLHNIVSFF